MVKSNLFQGKGDLQKIFEVITARPADVPVLIEKLKLLINGSYKGSKLLADSFKSYPANIKVGKHNQFVLWLNLVRKS